MEIAVMSRLYEKVLRFSERFGHMLSRLILTLLYFLLLMPAGIFITLFGDPLKIRRPSPSNWQKVRDDASDKRRSRSQI